jgi:decaprenylphospho-beta-D-ribofuranose 2-oxidase
MVAISSPNNNTMKLSGWGRYPRSFSDVVVFNTLQDFSRNLPKFGGYVARGNGRAYGDAAVGRTTTVLTERLNRVRSFDPESGRLIVESGVLLADILATFVPRGFFPPVVPGTKFVTVGGMLAADVHGKNHHKHGGFGDHVEWFTLFLPAGTVVRCSRTENSDIFFATIGGMGLTGIISEVSFRLIPIETGWITQRTVAATDLDATFAALDTNTSATYSVAWIDCLAKGSSLGRGLVYLGEHATQQDLSASKPSATQFVSPKEGRATIPCDLPSWILNSASVRIFNELYYRSNVAKADRLLLVPYDGYFFPLDGLQNWNKIYGHRGFVQYQCVIPRQTAKTAFSEMLTIISRRGNASFLAVLKQLRESAGYLSFPLDGYTLTMDFAVVNGLAPLVQRLDFIVLKYGGRLYLAKDSMQSASTFRAGYPQLSKFREVRQHIEAPRIIDSQLSERLRI